MEDPGEEWEIERYPTAGDGVNQSKISKILRGGLWLGKKFVITSFVISSAPVVLPPLVVVSALGFAVSIPFGVVFAGYTCTEKLMSKLLPMPESSGMLDYGPSVMDKAEEDWGEGVEFVMQEEENAQIQDTKESVEMRIELVEDANREQQEENMMPEMNPNRVRNVTIEDRSGDFIEGLLTKESEDERLKPVVTRVVVARPVEGGTENAAGGNEDAEVLKAESTNLLEKIRDEGDSGDSVKKNKKKNKNRLQKALGLGGKKENEIAKDTMEVEKNSEIRHENLKNFASGSGRTDTRQADEISPEEENIDIEISGTLQGETMKDTVLDNKDNAPATEGPIESQSILNNDSRTEGRPPNVVDEEVNSILGNKQANQGPEMHDASDRHEDMPVESNAIHRGGTGNGLPNKGVAARASTEISSSEKNLWEQINTLRLIVGYKAVPQPSLAEELKALYVFTGVETPSFLKDSGNIKEAEDKLRFLMSIVGVK